MGGDNGPGGFWRSIPGILTAIAGVVTAITGLILALHQAGFVGMPRKPAADIIRPAPDSKRTSLPPATPPSQEQVRDDRLPPWDLTRARALLDRAGPAASAGAFSEALMGKGLFALLASDTCDQRVTRYAISVIPKNKVIVLPKAGADCFRVACGPATSPAQVQTDCDFLAARLRGRGMSFDGRVLSLSNPSD